SWLSPSAVSDVLGLIVRLAGVRHDRINDRAPVGPVQFVSAPLDVQEFGTRYGLCERRTVLRRENRIGGAVNDEKRRFHFMKPALPCLADLEEDAVIGSAEIAA